MEHQSDFILHCITNLVNKTKTKEKQKKRSEFDDYETRYDEFPTSAFFNMISKCSYGCLSLRDVRDTDTSAKNKFC